MEDLCKAKNYILEINEKLQEVEAEKQRLYDFVHQCDLKTCDLLHRIELNSIGGLYNAYLTLKELKEVRELRRKAKDELETLYILLQDLRKLGIRNIINKIDNKEYHMKLRTYNVRCDCKLTLFK